MIVSRADDRSKIDDFDGFEFFDDRMTAMAF